MGRKSLNLLGKSFGKLSVVERDFTRGNKNSYWACRCSCGNKVTVSGINLKSGNSKSCGCTALSLGGKSKLPEFTVWQQMLQRCHNNNHSKYFKYGGRGIKVCDHWKDSFLNFLEDMGTRGSDSYSIDRLDNDKGYTPENCAWRTIEEQNNNRGKFNLMVTYEGETKTASQWAKQYGIGAGTFIARINRYGWSTERALTTAVRR